LIEANLDSVTETQASSLSLSEAIRQRFEGFSRSQKDVGQYIVDHLDDASFYTAEELARRANTSSSTVVRFAQALGFEGFPELQVAARDEYRRQRDDSHGPSTNGVGAFAQSSFESVLAADHSNIEATVRSLERDEVDACVETISQASSILLCGTDQMAFFASYLRHLLLLLDLRCEVASGASQDSVARLARIDQNSAVVAFSAGRPPTLVTKALKIARYRKAPTIAITDATLSEPAQLADRKLFYSSSSPAYVRSHAALLAVIQALAYGVYALDKTAYSTRLKTLRLK
jgi:DNA-binding MurR/RpiR family transcriptional regulator